LNNVDVEEEVRVALKRAAKGLTVRQLQSECESSGDLQEMVKVVHGLKASGRVQADGMRDSQVLYKLGNWEGETEMPVQKEAPKQAPRRSASGLREGLFEMMEQLRAGKVDVPTAKTYAALAMTICKSIEVQLNYERMRVANEIGELQDMTLVPALESKA
jgi:hypothetical protein